jgi:tetratricopeptide (TPR) repeat protein
MSERYRLPLLVPLTIGAGAAVDLFLTYIKERNWRRLAAPAAVAAVLLVAVNTRAMANDGKWEEGLRLAAQLVLQGKFDESDRWIERLEASSTRPGNASGSIGLQLLLKNEPARALKHLENAAKLDPNKSGIEYALGQALLGVGRAEDAIPHLRFGLENGATLPMTGYHLAAALKDAGRPAEAIAVMPRIRMTSDQSAENWLTVGRLGMELKVPEQAVPYFQKAVELAPGNAEARLQLGVALVVLKRFDDAAAELTEAARLDPKSAPALAYLAYSEQQLGRLDASRLHLGAALAIDPNDPMARLLASMR